MKKVIIVLAAIALAIGAQAAAVDWGTGNMSSFGVGKSDTGYTAQIFFFSDAAGENDITSTFGSGTQISSSKSDKSYSFGSTTADVASGTYYSQIVITRKSDGQELKSAISQFSHDGDSLSNTTINFTSGNGIQGGGSQWGGAAWAPAGGGAPEPTSALLLLVGGAMLALRRKRA